MNPFSDEDIAFVARQLPAPPSPGKTSQAGKTIPYEDYQQKQELARTHYSVTSKAWDPIRKAYVVIKEIHENRMLQRSAADQFRAEFSRAAQLSGPNIVPPLVPHLHEPPYFFTMPFIEGKHLDDYCESGKLNLKQKVHVFLDVCDAVRQAHEGGVIHCDLKPANILIDRDGKPRLIDFGLGQFLSDLDDESIPASGTLEYMAPEQFDGKISVRTDVYALGVILFKLLTGTVPFPRDRNMRLMEFRDKVQNTAVPDPAAKTKGVNWEFVEIVRKALSGNPEQRYQSVEHFAMDLRAWLSHSPVSAVPDTTGYRVERWMRRNWLSVSVVGCIFTLLVVAIGIWFQSFVEVSRITKENLYQTSVLYGRAQLALGNPRVASERFKAQLVNDSDWDRDKKINYAMWEFDLQYPCRNFIDCHKNLRRVLITPGEEYILASDDQGRVFLYKNAITFSMNGMDGKDHLMAEGTAESMANVPDDTTLATGSTDGVIRIWDYQYKDDSISFSSNPSRTIPVSPGDPVASMAFSEDAARLLAGTKSGNIYLIEKPLSKQPVVKQQWDSLYVPYEIRWFPGSSDGYICALYRNDSEYRAPAGLIIQHPNGKRYWLQLDSVRTVDFISDTHIAVGENSILIYSLEDVISNGTRTEKGLIEVDPSDVPAISWVISSDQPRWGIRSFEVAMLGNRLITACADGHGLIRTGELPSDLIIDDTPHIRRSGYHDVQPGTELSLAITSDGKAIVSVSSDGLRTWDVPQRHEFSPYDPIRPESTLILSPPLTSEELNETPVKLEFLKPRKNQKISARQFLWRGESVAISRKRKGPAGGCVSIVSRAGDRSQDVRLSAEIFPAGRIPGSTDECARFELASISPDANYLAFVEIHQAGESERSWLVIIPRDQQVPIFRAAIPDPKDKWTAPFIWITGETTFLLAGSKKGNVFAWKINPDGTVLQKPELITTVPGECSTIALNRDRTVLAIGSQGKEISLYSLVPNAPLNSSFHHQWVHQKTLQMKNIINHMRTMWCMAFVEDADGTELLACVGSSIFVSLIDIQQEKEIARLEGHRESINRCMACQHFLEPNQTITGRPHTHLITLSRDRTVCIWDIPNRSQLATLAHAWNDVLLSPGLFKNHTLIFTDEESIYEVSPAQFQLQGCRIE